MMTKRTRRAAHDTEQTGSPPVPLANELADAVVSTGDLLVRYLDGFDDSNATAVAANLPNHATWILGHLALTMHRAADAIGGRERPVPFDAEPFAFGSTPAARREAYPPLAEMVERFRRSLAGLVAIVREAGEEGLTRRIEWGRGRVPTTGRDLLLRMVFHNGLHCGQLIDMRRALGLGRVVG
jgi:hypothetical protein